MGGLEVHENQLFPVFSDGSHLVGVHADPIHTCQEVSGDSERIEVEGNDVGDPLHTYKEVSANGDRIEVEGYHVRLRIMVRKSRKTR